MFDNTPLIRTLATWLLWAGLWGVANAAREPLPDEIIVKYQSQSRFADHGRVARRMGNHLEVLNFEAAGGDESEDSKAHRLWQKIRQIRLDRNVLYAEPNFRGRFEETLPAAPNDPGYSSQWWLPAVGDREMWALGRGTGVIVAVIDTGVDLDHPDLIPGLLPNGYNFGDGNTIPHDVLGHGTRVAGIIAARQNNALGVSGLAPEARILPIKINVGGQNTFSSDRLANAIAYAVEQGSRIINLSLTVDQETRTVQDAIQSALDKGVIVVAAAGNIGGAVEFPATMPGVFAVAATDQSRRLSSSSNWGPEILVAAPGSNLLSTALGGGIAAAIPGGTSFAAPVVTATIADMLSINPALSVEVLSRQLRETALAIADGTYTFGNLHAGAAGNSLVPHLRLSKQQFSSADSLAVNFSLPPTGAAADIFVAVATPIGSFSLRPDGSWVSVDENGYLAIATGYRSDKNLSGGLFGSTALFPPIDLNGLPAGSYTWAIAILTSGRLVGDVTTATMQLQ